ncbi:13482_t:CDS:1 [Dentiscutata erythropus]|uniref:13482_t:CDS:1 n=1 Tax=Dentiscutata erythropus TaxID=1348616 RepID=A0A9N9NZU5_9GLOM|nr:13482_t:CDS:1 [Dentiscutata erythropus]
MVNTQEYVDKNFDKSVSDIIVIGKDMEGDLDLTDYSNLITVDLGNNPHIRSLKLAPSTRIRYISTYNTGITEFSFYTSTPDLENCFLNYYREIEENTRLFAQVIKDICRFRLRESQELSQIIFPNQSYNFLQLKQEITRLKLQELAPKLRREKTNLEQLIITAKKKAENNFEHIVDLLLTTQQEISKKNIDHVTQSRLEGELDAYQKILKNILTKEELQALLTKQAELCQLEEHLASLQTNQQ